MPFKHYEINQLGKDYFVSDIHGHYTLLRQELAQVSFNEQTDRLFSVGDLIDRGPESQACIALLNQPWFHSVLGNHELYFIESMYNKSLRHHYIHHDGCWLKELPKKALNTIGQWADLMKAKQAICAVIASEYGPIGLGHANFPENISQYIKSSETFDFEQIHQLTSSRTVFHQPINYQEVLGVVMGHNTIDKPLIKHNALWIDTLASQHEKMTLIPLTTVINLFNNNSTKE